jgi:hypothetical protein
LASSRLGIRRLIPNNGAGGGNRTRTPLSGPRILSPVRLPVPPPRHEIRVLIVSMIYANCGLASAFACGRLSPRCHHRSRRSYLPFAARSAAASRGRERPWWPQGRSQRSTRECARGSLECPDFPAEPAKLEDAAVGTHRCRSRYVRKPGNLDTPGAPSHGRIALVMRRFSK